ncbi:MULTISPECIES: hypothetical protein [Acinetobacter]|uniref:Uncharacterized protein n=1 Tax=Acinetobacter entericus TaxID=2989714 RepID=A0ABT3NGI7_9GAMM|nr:MULTISPECIES: hypothetical protein [Acinetobacter]MCW8038677.1 hypothetical protein [Acinetobacter entericus]
MKDDHEVPYLKQLLPLRRHTAAQILNFRPKPAQNAHNLCILPYNLAR